MSRFLLNQRVPLAFVAALVALPGAVHSAPVKERQVFPLVVGGSVRPGDLSIRDLAIVDENTVVVVGTTLDKDDGTSPDDLGLNGAIVDLARKTSRPFTNGHKSCICTVAVGRGRIATTSDPRDPFLRLWDLKTGKSVAPVQIDEPDVNATILPYHVRWFHKSDRVAVSVKNTVFLFDPAKPDTRTELACPEECGLPEHPVVSPDDARIAATATWCNLIVWDVVTKKPRVISLAPDKADPKHWMAGGCAFGPDGLLVAWRSPSGNGDVPRAKGEDVPGDRCEVVRIDGAKVVPLGIGGNTFDVLNCALDSSGTRLAVAGCSQLDKPRKDGSTSVGELRVYHLGTKQLAFREQVEGLPLTQVAFAPSGKRVVCCTYDGVVRWWDVKGK